MSSFIEASWIHKPADRTQIRMYTPDQLVCRIGGIPLRPSASITVWYDRRDLQRSHPEEYPEHFLRVFVEDKDLDSDDMYAHQVGICSDVWLWEVGSDFNRRGFEYVRVHDIEQTNSLLRNRLKSDTDAICWFVYSMSGSGGLVEAFPEWERERSNSFWVDLIRDIPRMLDVARVSLV